jgi:type II secretory pathway component PulM
MSHEMTTAMKTAKTIEKELVQNENRLAYVQDEVKRLNLAKDAQQAEIDKKTADYNIYISQRDAESKKIRLDVLAEREQLDKDKQEFNAILRDFQNQKVAFADQSRIVAEQNAKHEEQMNNVRSFVIAVQRACSLLGL